MVNRTEFTDRSHKRNLRNLQLQNVTLHNALGKGYSTGEIQYGSVLLQISFVEDFKCY